MHIGEFVNNLIKKNNLVKAELAKKLNLSPQNFQFWFTKESWTTDQIEKMSDLLGIDIYYLLSKQPKGYTQVETGLVSEPGNCDEYKKEIQYLKEINQLLKDKCARSAPKSE